METVSKTELNQKCTLQFLSLASTGTGVVEHQKAQLEIWGWGGIQDQKYTIHTHLQTYVLVIYKTC